MSALEDIEDLFQGRTVPTDVEIQSALRHWKNAVRVATTANVSLATGLEAGDTVDGVVLAEQDRVLVKDQTDPIENGIYVVAASGAASRASDMEATTDAAAAFVFVIEGTAGAETIWYCSDASFTEVGVDEITWAGWFAGAATGCEQSCSDDRDYYTPTGATVGGNFEGIDAEFGEVATALAARALAATQVIAGAGLTGGGTLATDRTLNVAAADASITVSADAIAVGVLQSDASHGTRGGGTQHAVATTGAAGFMSAADKTKLDSNGANGVIQIDGSSNAAPPGNVSAVGYLKTDSAGLVATPSVRVASDSIGLYRPATDQLGLVANGEAVVVDNDASTPALRGDVNNTWDIGEAAIAFRVGHAKTWQAIEAATSTWSVRMTEATIEANGAATSKTFLVGATAASAGANAVALDLRGGVGGTPSGAAARPGGSVGVTGGTGGAGNGSFAAGAGGNIAIAGGSAGADGGAGGDAGGTVIINAGAGTGAGANGSILIGYSNPPAAIQLGSGVTPVHVEGWVRLAEGGGTLPTAAANKGSVYVADDGGDTELYYRDDGGTDAQLTQDGYVKTSKGVRALGTSTFSIGPADDGRLCQWTGTSTGVAGTVDQGIAGQVTTIVLTGTAGTVTLTAGSGVTLEAEEGKTLTTNAPGASTAVTVSLLWMSATHVVATGGLA